MSTEIAQLLDVIDQNQNFLVVSHIHPDGDAVGSTLSMGLVLQALGKDVTFFNVHPVPYNFQFLPGATEWTNSVANKPEVTIVLDCGEPGRVGESFPAEGWGDTICVVDHHKTWDSEFADVYVRDVDAAATGELVFKIARELGVMNADIAQNIYCCLLTDTGSFRYSNTSRATFTIAGELVDEGVDPWWMTSNIYESNPKERIEMLSKVLSTLELSPCGRLAFLRIDQDMVEGKDLEIVDGFINYARSIRGVEVATQLLEQPGAWKISFRSRGNVDVSELAQRFGGGGHRNAAGCTIQASSQSVVSQLSDALVEMLDKS